jgi:iron complex outermembrane receptor protein
MKLKFNTMCCVSALIAGSPAYAQAVPPAASESEATTSDRANGGLEDIVVTATRRDSNLQRTPIAVTAISSQQIAATVPHDLGDLLAAVPNFSPERITGFRAASFAMRGVGQNAILLYIEPPVGVIVDDFVYSSIQSQLLDPFDIAQVEVLRGPQGTLFGKNTTGGAVVVRTKRPSADKLTVEATGLIGSFGTRQAKGAVNIPVIEDKLAVRLVGAYNYSDGYMRNGAVYGPIVSPRNANFNGVTGAGDGRRIGGDNAFNGRAKVLWTPNDDITILAQYEILRDKSEMPGVVDDSPANDPNFIFATLGFNKANGNPLHNAGATSRTDNYLYGNSPKVFSDGMFLNADFDLGVGTLTSVSGYRKQDSRLPLTPGGEVDIIGRDGTKLSAFVADRLDRRKTWQQELRFSSSFSGPFNFVAGLFYQRERVEAVQAQVFGFRDLLGSSTPFGPWNNNVWLIYNNLRSSSKAAFFEGNYKITPRVTLTAGLRYTQDKKRFQGRQQAFVPQITGIAGDSYLNHPDPYELGDFKKYPIGVIVNSKSWKEPSYRAILGWQTTDDVYTYASFSHGYKAGGYREIAGASAPFGNDLAAFNRSTDPTNPEKADSYEVGVKAELFDRKVRLNANGFYVKYSDVQKQLSVPLVVNNIQSSAVTYFNAASAEVKGFEAELTIVPTDRLTLRGNFGYQDGKYLKYVTPIPAGYDLSTAPLDRTPKWQLGGDATYTHPLTGSLNVVFNGNVRYQSRSLFIQSLVAARYNTFLDARTIFNASIGIAEVNNRYSLRIIGQNLTNKIYRNAFQVSTPLYLWSTYAAPRYVAVEVGFRL